MHDKIPPQIIQEVFKMRARIYCTTEHSKEMKKHILFHYDEKGIENQVINLYPEISYEVFEGFGGAITDASGYVYSLMNNEQKEEMMRMYFSKEGMQYNRVRIPMDSCDFAVEMYEAMSDSTDCALESFSFDRTAKYIIPMLEDAERMAGKHLKIMLSPWSPPSFMKTNGKRMQGGSLKPEYYEFWAEYMCRYIEEFQRRGFQVERMSLQNEPNAVQTWDSCVYTVQQEKEFLKVMHAALMRHNMEDIEVFIWDHNKERCYERTVGILDEVTQKMVAGVACHWYSGDHFTNLDLLRSAYPQLKLTVSESCIEFSLYDADDSTSNASRLAHEIIGDLNHGMTSFYDWNILLDEKGGPNHVGNFCDAPYFFDTKNKKLKARKIQKYFYQFAHFIVPGAK